MLAFSIQPPFHQNKFHAKVSFYTVYKHLRIVDDSAEVLPKFCNNHKLPSIV